MPLDPNIILQGRQPEIANPMDMMNKALTMRQLGQQTQLQDQQIAENQGIKSAFNQNVTTDANGNPTINKQGVLSTLMKNGQGKQAVDYQKMFADQDLDVMKKNTQTSKELAWSVSDEPSYQQAKAKMAAMGLPNADKMPSQFDPNFVKNWQVHTLEGEKQIDVALKEKEFAQKTQELGIKHEENSIKRDQMGIDREDKMAQNLDKHLALGWAGRSGQAGQVQGKMNNAEYVEGLINQGKSQPGGLDIRQVEEVAQGTARMLGGSAAASARVDALLPHSAVSKGMTAIEWLANKPQGAELQAFTDRMAETVAREKAIAQTQMHQFQVEGLAAHAALKKRNPELYNSILQSKGITPDMIDEKGRYKAPSAGANDFHSMSEDELDKAYKAAGGK